MAEAGRYSRDSSDSPRSSPDLSKIMELLPKFFTSGAVVDSFMSVPRSLAIYGECSARQHQMVEQR
ncbi:hypothetical protein E2C01_101648 [Portunus trituberculatus]|uniref:Uncharacterized protein n=1 Tax=Portunus trituberculatus TaxID=210409 RepID=A0A5B7KGK8_PORTR|nr:hypothetical protein [Portunus trituberculatus]